MSFTFYLGTHKPDWLGRIRVPFFVSNRVLQARARFPRALSGWALDSGGFSELSLFGKWATSPARYVELTRRYAAEIGSLEWAAVQDWMCEPFMLAKTGLSVAEHQRRTIDSYYELSSSAPEIPWVPVLQGFTLAEYLQHLDMYLTRGIDLAALPRVGLGSICRRQGTVEAVRIIWALSAGHGLRLHAFGFKPKGLPGAHQHLVSADSMAWSVHARNRPPLPGHTHAHCNNCPVYALRWRNDVLRLVGESAGLGLGVAA